MCNAATFARVGRACLAAFAFVILSASLAEALFGPRTTIGNNYQQWSNTESADGINPGSCTGTFCTVLFQAIPRNKPLIVQHVACNAFVSAGGLRWVRLQTRNGQSSVSRRIPLVPVLTTGVWAVNSPVMHLLKSGERPYVVFNNSALTSWGVECSISGKLQQP